MSTSTEAMIKLLNERNNLSTKEFLERGKTLASEPDNLLVQGDQGYYFSR